MGDKIKKVNGSIKTRFQKGNKVAVGNSGPPRAFVDYEKEAETLLAWAQKDDSLHLAAFALERKVYSEKLCEWKNRSPVFAQALKQAKDYLNLRVRKKLNDPSDSYYPTLALRDISNHDFLLRKHEKEDEAYTSSLRKKEIEESTKSLSDLLKMLNADKLSQL